MKRITRKNHEKISFPSRITLSRKKGWKMPLNTVKVDRSTKWGNPYPKNEHRTAAVSCNLFLHALVEGKLKFAFADVQKELRGKNIACWCKPGEPCHGDLLLKIAALADHRELESFVAQLLTGG